MWFLWAWESRLTTTHRFCLPFEAWLTCRYVSCLNLTFHPPFVKVEFSHHLGSAREVRSPLLICIAGTFTFLHHPGLARSCRLVLYFYKRVTLFAFFGSVVVNFLSSHVRVHTHTHTHTHKHTHKHTHTHTHDQRWSMKYTSVSVSTVGVVPRLLQLSRDAPKVNLALYVTPLSFAVLTLLIRSLSSLLSSFFSRCSCNVFALTYNLCNVS
jgi:hypothetical protein